MGSAVKPREERQKVMIKARMRTGVSWHDVCILNLSAHGVGLQAAEPPARGTYVEIRRGPHVIVARVAWSKGTSRWPSFAGPDLHPIRRKRKRGPSAAGCRSTHRAPSGAADRSAGARPQPMDGPCDGIRMFRFSSRSGCANRVRVRRAGARATTLADQRSVSRCGCGSREAERSQPAPIRHYIGRPARRRDVVRRTPFYGSVLGRCRIQHDMAFGR